MFGRFEVLIVTNNAVASNQMHNRAEQPCSLESKLRNERTVLFGCFEASMPEDALREWIN
jgi:hypothetical protein